MTKIIKAWESKLEDMDNILISEMFKTVHAPNGFLGVDY